MIPWPAILFGMCIGFGLSALLVGIALHRRSVRRAAFERFENIDSDERYLSQISYPPSYHFQREDYSSNSWSTK